MISSLVGSEPQIVIDRHGYVLLRPQVALRRLDRGVPQEKRGLLEITASRAPELCACAGHQRTLVRYNFRKNRPPQDLPKHSETAWLAEGEGFEPPLPAKVKRFSRPPR